MWTKRMIGSMLALGMLAGVATTPRAADSQESPQTALDQTPPRLSFTDGQVSFWRPGAHDWAQAQVNTPLAAGDELSTGSPGNLELQVGARAFVRAWAGTQLGLANQEPNFLQFKVTAGHASFDLRTLEPGRTVEVNTPNAAFTIEHAGYYRVDVTGERTSFITRRAGRATVTPASGDAVAMTPSEEVIIEGTSSPQVAAYVAPQLDDWDRWNYARTDKILDAVSARYVSPGTYGVTDLDRYGNWRVVPTYGSVWVPTAVQTGWVPYSTGSWTHDPFYGWTWVDTAPWGWAPYHHGRWVSVDGFWAWAPGPIVARPVYAPALVAFFGGPSVRVGITTGPVVGWVSLGWGEPVVPWWGRQRAAPAPSWDGWGGPRVVNTTVINNTTVVNVQNINVYRNSSVPNAVVTVNENHFGRGSVTSARVAQVDVKNLQVIHTAPPIAATPASFVPTATPGVRPPEESLKRSVVATRPPRSGSASATEAERKVAPPGIPTPPPHLVSLPKQVDVAPVLARPPLGQSKVERPTVDPVQPSAPPGPPASRQVSPQPRREPRVATPSPGAAQPPTGGPSASPPPSRRPEEPQVVTPPPAVVQPPTGRPAASPPPARRPEEPQVVTPPPAQPPTGRPSASPPTSRRPEEPQVVTPAPGAAQPPTGRPAASPPPGRRPEEPQVATPAPGAAQPPTGRPAASPPPGRRPEEPQVVTPAPGAAQQPAGRPSAPLSPARRPEEPQVATPAPGRRPEKAAPPAPPLPGEPANRLSPHRGETPPQEQR